MRDYIVEDGTVTLTNATGKFLRLRSNIAHPWPAELLISFPDQSTTLRVESSSTDDSRLRGALP
jgi:hypothetical protein